MNTANFVARTCVDCDYNKGAVKIWDGGAEMKNFYARLRRRICKNIIRVELEYLVTEEAYMPKVPNRTIRRNGRGQRNNGVGRFMTVTKFNFSKSF